MGQTGWIIQYYPITLTKLYGVFRGLRSDTSVNPSVNTISTWEETISSCRIYGDSNLIAGWLIIIGRI